MRASKAPGPIPGRPATAPDARRGAEGERDELHAAATSAELPSEVTTRERRGFIFVLGAVNLVFLALDLRSSWALGGARHGGRFVLSAALLTVALVMRERSGMTAARRAMRALALVAALAFGAILWGSGGTAGPYAAFFGVLPIVFNLAVPDDLVATLLFSAVTGTIGLARATTKTPRPIWPMRCTTGQRETRQRISTGIR